MTADPSAPASPRLLDRVRERIRVKHYSIRTEQAYVDWIRRFILFHGKRHPQELGAPEVEAFLTHLAVAGRVAASTQNQAKSALLFLYREVLAVELPWLDGVTQARAPKRLPVVLTRDEVGAVLARLEGTQWLIGSLLYGSGLRLMECLRLRVKDVDFGRNEILVRDGKGAKDRVTMLPIALKSPLQAHLGRVQSLHRQDLGEGYGEVYLPNALERKYPMAARAAADAAAQLVQLREAEAVAAVDDDRVRGRAGAGGDGGSARQLRRQGPYFVGHAGGGACGCARQGVDQPCDHGLMRQGDAEMEHDPAAHHRQGREVVHVDVADEFGVVLDVGPGEDGAGTGARDALERRAEITAGSAPGGTEGDDDEWGFGRARAVGELGERGQGRHRCSGFRYFDRTSGCAAAGARLPERAVGARFMPHLAACI